ncbi:MAG: four helix bundle protein [Bacteroidota bacterium]
MEYTKRHNINRGYMKLEVWGKAVELLALIDRILKSIRNIDFKLRSQILDSTQSISSNIAEGYCRRTIKEYLQALNVALGSSGESMTRVVGLRTINLVSDDLFEEFDKLHFEVENKLLALVKSLQAKRRSGSWLEEF